MIEPEKPVLLMLSTDAVDVVVGANLRRIRLLRKVSLTALGRAVGVSYQQIQKYENGRNTISCSMLVRISAELGCSINAFYEGLPGLQPGQSALEAYARLSEDAAIAHALDRIADRRIQQVLRNLIDTLGLHNTNIKSSR